MCEGFHPNDSDNGDFVDAFVPSMKIDGGFRGQDFTITAQNTHLRLFNGDDAIYNRALVDVGDGMLAPLPLDSDLLRFMAECGFQVERPERPDETDHEFISIGLDSLLSGGPSPSL
ncbi:MAG TPA: hypothetical protein VHB72_05080 [Candidatus Saccharimonadales bacterium]|nr:hypothetical protein [Candidatus Saccharimonadales bacterium]